MTAWLLAPWHGRPRWAWLLCAALLAGAAAWWGWATLAALPVALLGLWRPRSVAPREPAGTDVAARDALRGHEAASETDRALAGVQAESVVREAQGAQAAATDPADEVAARVAARGRKP